MFEEASRFKWNRIPEEEQPDRETPSDRYAEGQAGQTLRSLPARLSKNQRKLVRNECVKALSGGVTLTAAEVTIVLGYENAACGCIKQVLDNSGLIQRGDGGRYSLADSGSQRRVDHASSKLIDPQSVKLVEVARALTEFTPMEEVTRRAGVAGPVDYDCFKLFGIVIVVNEGREFVGTRGLLDRKINAAQTVFNRGQVLTMEEVAALFYPLAASEQYLKRACGGLVEVSGGYVGRRALEATTNKASGSITRLISQKGFVSAAEISDYLRATYGFEFMPSKLGYEVEVLVYKGELWYFHSQTTKKAPFPLGATRDQAGLPLRPPIKSGSVFIYMGCRMALVSEAARMLGISVPRVKALIESHTLEAFTFGKTTRVSIESLFANNAKAFEKSPKEIEAQAALNRLHPVTRTDLGLTPLKRGVSGNLAERLVSFSEAASLLALEREEIARITAAGILKPAEKTDCFSATDVMRVIRDRSVLEGILSDRLVTTYEAVQILGVSKAFVYDMCQVIKKRGQNEYGMNLYRRGDVLQYVGRVEELIRLVRKIPEKGSGAQALAPSDLIL